MILDSKSTKTLSIYRLMVVSAVAGGLSAVVKSIISWGLYSLGVTKWSALLDTGALIFSKVPMPLDFWHVSLAFFVHALWGSTMGLGLGLIYLVIGKKHSLLSGAFYGFVAWMAILNSLINVSTPKPLPSQDALSAWISLINHFVWGALAGFIIVKYYPFKEEATIQVTETSKIRRFLFAPVPARKQEQNERKVRFVKPKKL